MNAIPKLKSPKGLTLIELTLVIFVMIAFTSIAFFAIGGINDWRAGKEASEKLRSVYSAQRAFLADNVTRTPASIEEEELIPYLPQGMKAVPTVTSLEGEELNINFNVSPPIVISSGGEPYDPSGDPSDGIWDVGEK